MSRVFRIALLVVASIGSAAALAVPYTGVVLNNGSNYSVVHLGPTGGGAAPSSEWMWFDPIEQSIDFDYDSTTMLLTATNQVFSVQSSSGATATFTIDSLSIDKSVLDTGLSSDLAGSISYTFSSSDSAYFTSGTTGTLLFYGIGNGSNGFNSSVFSGDVLTTQLWGGDTSPSSSSNLLGSGIGIDLKFDGVAVPEPGTLALLGSGLLGLGLSRRRRAR